MRSFSIFATASLAASAVAFPESFFSSKKVVARDDGACMSASEADKVGLNFQHLIDNYSTANAEAQLTVDFEDYSASVTSLIDNGCTGPQPLDAVTFGSRDAFIAGQGSQANIPFERLNLWYSCNQVFLRWRTALTPEFVTGIIVLETEQAPAGSAEPWLIKTVYSEFNSGAWLVDLGSFTPANCSASTKRSLRA